MTSKQFFIVDTTLTDSNLISVDEMWENVMECIPSIKSVTKKTETGSYGRIIPNLSNPGFVSCEIPVTDIPDDPLVLMDLVDCVKAFFKSKNVYIGAEIKVRGMIQECGKVRIYSLL